MGANTTVATLPATLVTDSSIAGIYQRISVTNGAGGATLFSLLTLTNFSLIGGKLYFPVPNKNANLYYVFGGVDLASETDPLAGLVRYIDNGSDAPTGTLGFVVPKEPSWVRIIGDLSLIKLIGTLADTKVQVRLLVTGTTAF